MKVKNLGNGSIGNVESWAVTETVTPIAISDSATSIGDATLEVIRKGDTDLLEGNRITLKASTGPYAAEQPHMVNTVTMTSPATASLTADSDFAGFISSRLRIPGIESGIPLAALDVACQAGGRKRQKGVHAGDDYWSLNGHSVGFNVDGDIVEPASVDRVLTTNNVAAGAWAENVLYQEITRYCGVADFVGLYPRRVIGDTVQLSRETTYIKVTLNPAISPVSVTTFTLPFGPAYRRFGSSAVANTTNLSLSLSTTPSSGTLSGAITYQNAAGTTQTTSIPTSGAVAALARTNTITLVIELSMVNGGIRARAYAASAAGSTSIISGTTPSLSAVGAMVYTKQWSIQQNASGGGLRDLVTARSTSDRMAAFLERDYAEPAAVVSEAGAGSAAGSPIAGHDGELWDYVKQVCSARQVELSTTPSGLVARTPGLRTIDLTKRASAARGISGAVTARKISITNHRTSITPPEGKEIVKASTVYSIGVGESKTVDIPVPNGVRFLASPRPWYSQIAVNGILPANVELLDGYAELTAGTTGRYYVTAADGFPVSPTLWTDRGGRVTAAVKDGKASITLTGPTAEIPGVAGPFRIGESSGSTDYAVLRLFGVGVLDDPVEVDLPSGAAKVDTRVEKAGTVTNVAIGNIGEVYKTAPWVAQRVAGPTITLTAILPMGLLAGWGLVAGSLVTFEDNVFRVNSVSYSSGVGTLACSKLSRLKDTPGPGRTLSQFAADYAGLTVHDHSIRPLALKKPTP